MSSFTDLEEMNRRGDGGRESVGKRGAGSRDFTCQGLVMVQSGVCLSLVCRGKHSHNQKSRELSPQTQLGLHPV